MENHADPWTYTEEKKREDSYKLGSVSDLDPLMERIGDARYVLLGEASHGTHEYYTWRTAITKRLIKEKGFNFIAVEGDWPACYKVNRYVKGYKDAGNDIVKVLGAFERWPTWMWGNWEIAALAEWLKEHNSNKPFGKKAGFYGLDVYSLWESIGVIIHYLEKEDPEAAKLAKKAMNCFEPFGEEGTDYSRATMRKGPICKDEVINLLVDIRQRAATYDQDPEAAFNAEQNAHIAANAENYYRTMASFGNDSWNVRDRHMMDTLNRLTDFHGADSKVIVWEHNTHIGDARYTDMARGNMFNVGQLAREEHADKGVVLVGFGSYEGTVIAGDAWGAPMEVMKVPPAREGSVEEILYNQQEGDRLLLFHPENEDERWDDVFMHRAIGVVYHPERDIYGNYMPSRMARRYDAFLFLEETKALHPLQLKPDGHKVPETWPFSV